MIISSILCLLLVAMSGGAPSRHDFSDRNVLENEIVISDRQLEERNKRGVTAVVDKILKKTSVIYASKRFKVYKKKGGYTQALEDFNKLVPTPTGNYGLTRWGDIDGKRRVYLQNQFGKPVISIWKKDKTKGDTVMHKIEYF